MKMSIEEKSKKAKALAQMAEELVEERGDVVLFNLAKDNLVNVSVRGSHSEIAFSMLNPVGQIIKDMYANNPETAEAFAEYLVNGTIASVIAAHYESGAGEEATSKFLTGIGEKLSDTKRMELLTLLAHNRMYERKPSEEKKVSSYEKGEHPLKGILEELLKQVKGGSEND